MSIGHLRIYRIRKPTTVTAKEITSRQKNKTHGKGKNLTPKRKRLGAKEKTMSSGHKRERGAGTSFRGAP